MFRWCAYCQHLIGEVAPLDDYSITHGLCSSCEPDAERYRPTPAGLRAQAAMTGLLSAGRAGRYDSAVASLEEASAAGATPIDLMIGLLQPALFEIGRLWKTGKITTTDEHRFTSFCERAMSALPAPPEPPLTAPLVLLVLVDGNAHDLGVRMLSRVAAGDGARCEALYPGSPNDDILSLCRRERPALLGVSASLPEHLPPADVLARRVTAELGIKTVLGGGALRRGPVAPLTTPTIETLDAFRALVAGLKRSTRPPPQTPVFL